MRIGMPNIMHWVLIRWTRLKLSKDSRFNSAIDWLVVQNKDHDAQSHDESSAINIFSGVPPVSDQ